ncbi:glucosamine inositolphosphorylceramide transferase family protein [Natrononativus amylolyticus]|uniref:glucosamine inositolphosphorylceramide transferase family protein n=1 Tax=Natrononativus amylolyticus TaxID=2963434 RepID=UPI0020CFCC28|nr:hypothetical protein [Natrononativus amylolyticus]
MRSAPLLESHNGVSNPVLSAADVTDCANPEFVADPFYAFHDDTHHLFFEILDDGMGVIGHATSDNGLNWSYQQVILKEPFHLSYPYVFQSGGEWYMLPEHTAETQRSLRIYKAVQFPRSWVLAETALSGKRIIDPTLVQTDDTWFLFVSHDGASVELYFSDKWCTDTWIRHPKSPITETAYMGRMAGRPIGGEPLFLPFQDLRYLYGELVRCCRVDRLTPTEYSHTEIGGSPILRAQFTHKWNDRGMHHIDCSPVTEFGHDFVVVDGCNPVGAWSISLYQPTTRAETLLREQKLLRRQARRGKIIATAQLREAYRIYEEYGARELVRRVGERARDHVR